MTRAVTLIALALVLAETEAGAEKALEPAYSASRDAPVVELAYGPRAQLSVGRDLELFRGSRFDVRFSALAALENAGAQAPLPDELGRLVLEVGVWWRYDRRAARWFGNGAALATGVTLGVEQARKLGGVEGELVVPAPQPGDIPFGGGGTWTGFEVAARFRLGCGWSLRVRARERVFLNAWPLLLGRRDWSDYVANGLGEGLAHAPSLEATLVWRRWARAWPLASLFAEGLFPHDRSAGASGFVRLLAGVGFGVAGGEGEVIPFASFDAGAGKGLLVNRHELRLSAGVRLVW